jgi:LuxR family maltose regulon positive regulatory protein
MLRPDGEPGTELLVHHARGLLRLVRGRPGEALKSFEAAQRMQTFLADKHPFALRTRARLLQTQVRLGQMAAAQAAIAEMSDAERGASEIRMAAAVIQLTASEPEQALDVLVPVIEGSSPTMHPSSAMTEAQVLDAVAREQLGDTRAAAISLETALELAEPQGIVLPFILAPARAILERLPRHRTAHATLRRTILDVLTGEAPTLQGKPAPPLDELSEAELRVVRYLPTNLRAPEIAAELFVSTNTIRTHQRHIYAKLGAHGRGEAVARARELGLLAPTARALSRPTRA